MANDGVAGARAALERGESALVWRRQIADTDTPISAALKLFEPDRGDYLVAFALPQAAKH